jgi:hypothetical protein
VRTRQHVIADLGVNFVERVILLACHTPEEPRHDYGFDLLMLTYGPAGEPENGCVWFQVKATDHLQPHADGSTIPLVVEAADLSLWLFDPFPVMLVLYDAQADRAFWVDLQQYAHDPGIDTDEVGETVTIRVPAANLLTVEVVRRWRDEKNARLAPRP